ncbi:carboxylating nicotinate-nucleotide diphosphorylase [Alteribacillus sp. HJP-4]|uniref:carboxylating nicotinate-nucleotide diphosphorylase n=1 Tax=Alteribacillus sp. HJP-4 TaxID=2775394 RepID=UPI0035CD03C6
MNRLLVRKKLTGFFNEDIGTGDVTTDSIFSDSERTMGAIIAKSEGFFSGSAVFLEGMNILDPSARVTFYIQEGEKIEPGQTIAHVEGNTRAVLSGERVLLNLLQRMSGITTMTRKMVEKLNDSSIRICDTRKTTPGLRIFEKYAVRCGGGLNHRIGLYDAVMIKDNHIAAAGSIPAAVDVLKQQAGHMVKIEVETTNAEEVNQAVRSGADIVMFDNCPPEKVRELSTYVPAHIYTEVSGNITIANVADYKGSGVNFLSVGALTHSITSCDLSFLIS